MAGFRVAIGGIMHESNTFSKTTTKLEDFEISAGEELLEKWRSAYHEITGFILGGGRAGFRTLPTMFAEAVPSGIVEADAFETLVGELVSHIRRCSPLDGLLLALHGAMVSERFADADGEIVRKIRQEFDSDFPIVVTNDFHANVSERTVEAATALVVYQTNPHVDQLDTGVMAANLLKRILSKEVKPVSVLRKPPIVLNIVHQNTSKEPLRSLMQAAGEAKNDPKVLAASIVGGYQYADVPQMGPSIVIVTDNDLELANGLADKLADLVWSAREQFRFALPDPRIAVKQAKESRETPVVLVDMGDNIGAGSSGDSTFILRELLDQGAEGWLVVVADPQSVQECSRHGEAPITIMVGGKTDDMHGEAVRVTGHVRSIHDGKYEEVERRHGGRRYHDQGLTVVLDVLNDKLNQVGSLVLTTRREPPFSLEQLRSLGINPQKERILVVKAAIAYRGAYGPIAKEIIEVDSPGLTCVNPSRFKYQHVRAGLWGL